MGVWVIERERHQIVRRGPPFLRLDPGARSTGRCRDGARHGVMQVGQGGMQSGDVAVLCRCGAATGNESKAARTLTGSQQLARPRYARCGRSARDNRRPPCRAQLSVEQNSTTRWPRILLTFASRN